MEHRVPEGFDWRHPDYTPVFIERTERLKHIRANPSLISPLKRYYRDNPAQFITDWGCTIDPRNAAKGKPVVLPFILFPRQVELIEWVMDSWKNQRPGVVPKSRELGVSWIAVALSVTLCLFYNDITIGFGSRKLELVDNLEDPDSLLPKARQFTNLLPVEFRGSWSLKDAPEKRVKFPDTGSIIKGEGGDNIGRGGRASLYWVDEAAHLEHPEMIEASLSETTECRMDVSSANGTGNPFHRKVTSAEWKAAGRIFYFHWRDDPRKDDEWYAKRVSELDPVTVAQEIDIDFSASVEGVVIPSAWVQAAVDSHIRLGIVPTGAHRGALDIADQGKDKCAFARSHGILVTNVEAWSGKDSDTFRSVQRAFGICDESDPPLRSFTYDADGMGALVRGDARVINEGRTREGQAHIDVVPFRGSGEVTDPDKEDIKGRKNKDYFANQKAQSAAALRRRFMITFRAITAPSVEAAQSFDPDDIISLSSEMPNLAEVMAELSQPTWAPNALGKMVVDKAPDGTLSPNLYDAIMMLYGRAAGSPMKVSAAALEGI